MRDVAVQGVGTVLGGAVLAGLAQLAGLIPTDPLSIVVIAILTLSLGLAAFTAIRGATEPSITRGDLETAQKIQSIDVSMEILDQPEERSDADS